MIRSATPDDLLDLIEMGRKFVSELPLGLAFSESRLAETLLGVMQNGILVVCESEGRPIGAAAAVAAEVWFAEGKIAQEMFWWSEGCGAEAHSLREALEEWAKQQGCAEFTMICLENPKAGVLSRLYRRAGYRPVEHHFMKAL